MNRRRRAWLPTIACLVVAISGAGLYVYGSWIVRTSYSQAERHDSSCITNPSCIAFASDPARSHGLALYYSGWALMGAALALLVVLAILAAKGRGPWATYYRNQDRGSRAPDSKFDPD